MAKGLANFMGKTMPSPYRQYPASHGDVLSSLMQTNTAASDLETAKRRSEMAQQAKQFAQRYELQGMQNQLETQNQRNALAQTRMDGVFGPAGNILRGLFN